MVYPPYGLDDIARACLADVERGLLLPPDSPGILSLLDAPEHRGSGVDGGGGDDDLSLDGVRQLSASQPIGGLSLDGGRQLSMSQPISSGDSGASTPEP